METYTCGTISINPFSLNKIFPFVETYEGEIRESLSVTIVTDKTEITLIQQQVERFANSYKDKVDGAISVDEWIYRIAMDMGCRGESHMRVLGYIFNYYNMEEDMESEVILPGRFFRD